MNHGIRPSLDTQGAQIRVTSILGDSWFNEGDDIVVQYCPQEFSHILSGFDIGVNHPEFFKNVLPGDEIKLGFEGLIGEVTTVDEVKESCHIKAITSGNIELNTAFDISGKSIQLAPFTEFDIDCIKGTFENNVETIYVSFCNSADAIILLRNILKSISSDIRKHPKIIAKIENKQGLLNLHEIINHVDGILVDRGDLSREVRISVIPSVVSSIIKSCRQYNCPCFVATNVLDTMINESLPSRAEISDIYNLLSKGVSGFVLAAEVAIGKHPVESVQVIKLMHKIHELDARNLMSQYDIGEFMSDMPANLKAWL